MSQSLIQAPFDYKSFSLLEERGKHEKDAREGEAIYTISHYKDLDEYLGSQWHMRVLNVIGDFICNFGHNLFPPHKRKANQGV